MSFDLLLEFWDPSISRERFELETSNLACRLATGGTNDKNKKIRSKGIGKGTRDLLLKFWDPLHISGTVWARNLKFGMQINEKNEKLGQRGSGRSHVTYFWNFGTPSIFGERFELETSKLARRLTTGGTNEQNEKLGQMGSGSGVIWPTFGILGPLHISGTVWARNFKFGMQIDHRGH